jgi:hypothetical protein
MRVSDNGMAIAEIKAETLVIHGSVVSSVEVTNKVDLRSGGSLIGEVISAGSVLRKARSSRAGLISVSFQKVPNSRLLRRRSGCSP